MPENGLPTPCRVKAETKKPQDFGKSPDKWPEPTFKERMKERKVNMGAGSKLRPRAG